MLSLNQQEREVFLKLARGNDGKVLKTYISKLIDEVSSVDNLTSDVIKNAQNVRTILRGQLLEHLIESKIEKNEEDTYE